MCSDLLETIGATAFVSAAPIWRREAGATSLVTTVCAIVARVWRGRW